MGITSGEIGRVWVLATDSSILQLEGGRFVPTPIAARRIRFGPSQWDTSVFWGADDTRLYRFTRGRLMTIALPGAPRGIGIARAEQEEDGTIWIVTSGRRIVSLQISEPAPRCPRPEGDGTDTHVTNLRAVFSSRRRPILRTQDGTEWRIAVDVELVRHLSVPAQSAGRDAHPVAFQAMFTDREGNVWLGGDGQGSLRVRKQVVTVYSRQHGFADRNVYPIFQDRRGAIWIGAWATGVSRLEGGQFRNYTVEHGLALRRVTALGEDGQGRVGAAAHHEVDGGLRVFERGRFRPLAGNLLAPGSRVTAIERVRDGSLWIGTTKGLVHYRPRSIKRYTMSDGLASDDVRVIVEGEGGVLWVGSYGGLTRIEQGQDPRGVFIETSYSGRSVAIATLTDAQR